MSPDGAATTTLKIANPINLFIVTPPPEVLPAPQPLTNSLWPRVRKFDAKGRSVLGFSGPRY
jgi:hypothetical protein